MDKNFSKTYIFLCLAAILWGAQPVVVKVVLKELSPTLITFFRYLSISVILLTTLFITDRKNFFPPATHIFTLVLMGFTGVTLNNVLQFSGLQYSTAINCTLISATIPTVTSMLAAIFLQEQMHAIQWLGILISFLGVLFLVSHGAIAVVMNLSFNYGDVLFFCSQVCWAVYTILGRKVMQEMSPVATTAWAGLAGAVLTGVFALWEGPVAAASIVGLTANGAAAMSYLIIGGGVLAMIWWNSGVKTVGAGQAAIFANIMPLVGMLFAVMFLGEHLGWREIVGGVWIIFGVYLTNHSHQVSWDSDGHKPVVNLSHGK